MKLAMGFACFDEESADALTLSVFNENIMIYAGFKLRRKQLTKHGRP